MKIYVTTDGCEVGQLYSKYVNQFFLKSNSEIINTSDATKADLLIFYACGLTEKQEEKSIRLIAALKSKMKPSARFVVWGCLSKQNPESLKKNFDGPLIGPSDMYAFEEILKQALNVTKCSSTLEIPDANLPITEKLDSGTSPNKLSYLRYVLSRAIFFNSQTPTFYVRVAEGCTAHCTYCSEHLVWGKVKSKPIEKVISEFKDGLQKGYRLFELCAEDFGAYGVDIGLNACDLLKRLIDLSDDANYRIIICELSPGYLKNMFANFDKIFASEKISRLGVQVESGSNRILKLMGRQYKAAEWRNMMLYINRKYPRINLATHFMVGFPTETEEDFKATMRLLNFPLFLKNVTIYKFSANPHVPAAKLSGQIPKRVIEMRAEKLQRKFLSSYPLNMTIRYSYLLAKNHHEYPSI
ncbi:MAG: radical SAM protein [Candidatus Bathyarchaeia archaeon]|jgi:threonylcarbamoyladenosine tRNA methylthiotransferase MtaB